MQVQYWSNPSISKVLGHKYPMFYKDDRQTSIDFNKDKLEGKVVQSTEYSNGYPQFGLK